MDQKHSQRTRRAPNLLFVFADQMRGMDMCCAGNGDLITPTFDAMARAGVMCTRSYATTPICGPNRACLLTGRYGTHNGVLLNDRAMPVSVPTLGTVAKENGYRTGYIGKWHLDGKPRDKWTPPGARRGGFDDFWAVYNCTHDYLSPRYYRETAELIREPGYEPEVQTDLAMEFLEGVKGDERPFCLVLSWGPPHDPYEQVPEKYRRMYDAGLIRPRQNCRPIPSKDMDPIWSVRSTTADYYALITSLDEQMARLLAKLEALGVVDDTIVVFTSDHGDMLWSQGLMYKSVPWEESVSVPLILKWPGGLPAGRREEGVMGTVDLLPTLCGLMGLDAPEGVQGADLSGAIRGDAGAKRQEAALLGFYGRYVFRPDVPITEWRAVRTERHTYAERLDRKPWLFYDNERDPFQMTNLAGEGRYASEVARLSGLLGSRLEEVGDPFLSMEEMVARFGG